MLNNVRFPVTSLTQQIRRNTRPQLTYQPSQNIFNFFNKESSNKKFSKKDDSDSDHEQSSLQKFAFFLKDGFARGPESQQQIEKRHSFQEAHEKEELAQTFFSLGKYQQALEHFKKAYNLIKVHCQEDDPKLAYYIQKIGDIYYEVKDFDQAINHYEQSLEILVNGLGERNCQVARSYFVLGMCYIKLNNHGAGIQNLKTSLELYQSCKGNNENTIASCYSMLTESYLYFGMYGEALESLENLLKLLRKMNGSEKLKEENDPLMTQYYLNYGFALAQATQNYETAFKYMNHYLVKQLDINGAKSLRTANCYLKMGQVRALQGMHKEALEYHQNALEITQKVGGDKHKQIGSCFNAIGLDFLEQENYSAAIEHFEKAVKYFEEGSHQDMATYYKNLGIAFQRQGNYEKAIQNFEKSAEERSIFCENLKETDTEISFLHASSFSLAYQIGDYKTATNHYEKLLETFMMLNQEEVQRLLSKKKPTNCC